ncbi:hypothetical protein SDC9_186182 [bioreactor metagenome]|uniref:Uncharacterized protein n=1 Tax=bioreactor metagenome TaxID=1076179 RepID=A0A645HHZ7_9ZZZZ
MTQEQHQGCRDQAGEEQAGDLRIGEDEVAHDHHVIGPGVIDGVAVRPQQRQRQVQPGGTACAQAYHQGVFPHLGIGRGVGKAIDQQQIDHQQRKARRRGRRNDEELAPLHVVRPQHDEPPGQAHGQLAQAARHQCQWRR